MSPLAKGPTWKIFCTFTKKPMRSSKQLHPLYINSFQVLAEPTPYPSFLPFCIPTWLLGWSSDFYILSSWWGYENLLYSLPAELPDALLLLCCQVAELFFVVSTLHICLGYWMIDQNLKCWWGCEARANTAPLLVGVQLVQPLWLSIMKSLTKQSSCTTKLLLFNICLTYCFVPMATFHICLCPLLFDI